MGQLQSLSDSLERARSQYDAATTKLAQTRRDLKENAYELKVARINLSASQKAVSSKGLFFPILLSIVVGALGFIACFIGAFVTLPVAYIAVAYLYRYAAGQPVAA